MGQIEQPTITVLNDIVDTLKLQFYASDIAEEQELKNFNSIIDKFLTKKDEAQKIKNPDNQKRFVSYNFGKNKFRVMASSQGNFNVVIQNGDITIGLLKHSYKHKNPLIKVEFRAEFLCRMGYKNAIQSVKNIINDMILNYHVKVSEIHLAKDIQGYHFTSYDFHRFVSLSRTKEVFHENDASEFYFGRRFTGFSIGKGDEMLRIYNKTVEISKKKEKSFIQVLKWSNNPDFNENQVVWRIEFQLRRARLKQLLGKYGLLDSLDSVLVAISSLWKYCTNRFVHKEISRQKIFNQMNGYELKNGLIKYESNETIRKRYQRAEISYLWSKISSFKATTEFEIQRIKDIKKPEVLYVENSFKSLVSTFVKLKRGEFCGDELTDIILKSNNELISKSGMNIIDTARLKALDYISHAKTFYEKNGVIEDGFDIYKKDFQNNLKSTFALIENEPSNILTFEQFQKRINKAS